MSYRDDLNLPQVTAADACRAAGIDMATFKNWVSRGAPTPVIQIAPNERREGGARSFFQLSLRSVYHLALVAELIRRGFELRRAHGMASRFSHMSSEKRRPDSSEVRDPGALFDDGRTYLVGVAAAAGSYAFNVMPTTPLISVVFEAESRGGVAALLHVDPIVWRVRQELGLPPRPMAEV